MLPCTVGTSPPAERPGATSRRPLSTDQRQETPYVPSPAFNCRAAPQARTIEALTTARQSIGVFRTVPRFFGLPQASQAHQTLPVER